MPARASTGEWITRHSQKQVKRLRTLNSGHRIEALSCEFPNKEKGIMYISIDPRRGNSQSRDNAIKLQIAGALRASVLQFFVRLFGCRHSHRFLRVVVLSYRPFVLLRRQFIITVICFYSLNVNCVTSTSWRPHYFWLSTASHSRFPSSAIKISDFAGVSSRKKLFKVSVGRV